MPTTNTRRSPLIPLVIAGIAALLAVVGFVASRTGESPSGSAAQAAEPGQSSAAGGKDPLAGLARREPNDPMAMGEVDAPVVMISYSEFQCPFCGKFARDTEPTLVKKYVDTGVLRIEWRDFPYLGEESMTSALAGRAAAEQGKFWEFHDAMYADQQPVNGGKLTKDYLRSVAEGAGLDGEQLVADMDRPELKEAVQRDAQEGQSLGVTGTPAFIVGGQPIIGAQPIEVFEQAIEAAATS